MILRAGQSRVIRNAAMLYAMTAAKIVLPLMVLPYLTRVLSKDCYGVVAYVKSLMAFAQVAVDFGFMLSATKDVAIAGADKEKISDIIGDVLVARLLLAFVVGVGIFAVAINIPLLKGMILFTMLNFVVVALTVFLFDFLFRGIEEMSVITSRYVIMRSIAVALTFLFVRSDADLMMLPLLDIVGSVVAIGFVWREVRKRGFALRYSGIRAALRKIVGSAVYFVSNAAATVFNALCTLLVGVFLPLEQVADWSLSMQLVGVVQVFYSPIAESLYPHMIKNRDFRFAKFVLVFFLSAVAVGCVFVWFSAEFLMTIAGGEKYRCAAPLFRALIPVLFFSFPAILFGWPMLGAIGRVRETTMTTVMSGGFQILGMAVLALVGAFSVFNLAFLRGATEALLWGSRCWMFCKFRNRRAE